MASVLAQRIRAARMAMRPSVTQREFARGMDLSASAVNLWEKGKSEPSAADLVKLAQWFDVSVDWLLGAGVKPAARSDKTPIHMVPLVPFVALTRWSWDTVSEFLQTAVLYPPQTAAAVLVASDALSSSCPAGAFAVVSKVHPTLPGSIVMASLGRGSEPVLRRLVHEGSDDLLVADDPRYPTYRLEDGAKLIGRVTEIVIRKIVI